MCVCVRAKLLQSCPTLCDPWTVAVQAPLSMGFSRQQYWSELPCPPLGDRPDPGIEAQPLVSPALAGGLLTTRPTWDWSPAARVSCAGRWAPDHWPHLGARAILQLRIKTVTKQKELLFNSVPQWCQTRRPHKLQHARLPRPSPTPRAYSNSCP